MSLVQTNRPALENTRTGSILGRFSWSAVATVAIAICSTVALVISGYLGWVSFNSSSVAGCGQGSWFNCDHVMSSKWGSLFGLPVGFAAMLLHGTLLFALAVSYATDINSIRMFSRRTVTVLAMTAAAAAIWFISLQWFVVESLCSYCLVAHVCGLMVAVLAFWRFPLQGKRSWIAASTALVVGMGTLVTGQVLAEKPATYEVESFDSQSTPDDGTLFQPPTIDESNNSSSVPSAGNRSKHAENNKHQLLRSIRRNRHQVASLSASLMTMIHPTANGNTNAFSTKWTQEKDDKKESDDSKRVILIQGGKLKLDIHQWPLVGKTDAKYVFVEMLDYTCPHCRENHRYVKQALKELGDDGATIVIPVPLNSKCNSTVRHDTGNHAEACELAELSVAVWRVDAKKFESFHHWMLDQSFKPSYKQAYEKASSIVDADQLKKELKSGVPGRYVSRHVELYKAVGSGTVPKMLFTGQTLSGKVSSSSTLVETAKKNPSK